MDFNYRFDLPWEKQLSPDYVAESRRLSWQWLGLVERNNNIVLEYKKKEQFTASVRDWDVLELNADHHYKPLSLNVSVNGHRAVDSGYDIQWHLPPQLVVANSISNKLQGDSQSVDVLVPPFKGKYVYTVTVRHRASVYSNREMSLK
ncbi:hypothetical protein F0243_27445 [Vibrio mediterranei]|nr:hypothetical protein [Vibrio mediterranei]